MASGQDPLLTLLGQQQQSQQPQQSPMMPQQGGVLPPTNPVQPQGQAALSMGAGSPIDIAQIVSQLSQMPQYKQASEQLGTIYGQESDVQKQQADLAQNRPQMRWQPKYESVTGLGSVLRDAGKGILQALSFTGPGQQIQNAIYGPGVRDWERKKEALAGQLQTLRAQQEIPQEEMRGTAGLAQAGGLAAYRGGELGIQKQRADAYAQSVQGRLQVAMQGLDLKKLMAGDQMELMRAKTKLDQVAAQTMPERIAMQQYGIDSLAATRTAIANMGAQMGMDKTHPFLQLLDSTFGTSLTPATPQTPQGAQPVQGASPLPQRSAKPTGSAVRPKTGAAGGGMYKFPDGSIRNVSPDKAAKAKSLGAVPQ